jgi:hypothetical protein
LGLKLPILQKRYHVRLFIDAYPRVGISAPAQSSSTKIRPPKEKKVLVSKYKGTAKPPGDRLTNLRTEDGSLTGQEKQVASQDSSSEEEESSSEEESEDEDTEMPVFTDISTVSNNLSCSLDSVTLVIVWLCPARAVTFVLIYM